jgi:hypothetical protein
MTDLVFVASLAHSGSTLLDLALGAHSRFVGLGEVFQLLKGGTLPSEQGEFCSCGETLETCSFWGSVLAELHAAGDVSVESKYRIVLNFFQERFPRTIPLDSSKYLPAVRTLARIPGLDVKVLHLVRDVRSWSTSIADVRKRRLVREGITGMRAWLIGQRSRPTLLFREWYRRNRRLQAGLRETGFPILQLGYEELALAPDRMLARIHEFLGVEAEKVESLVPSRSHAIFGNRMRLDPEKRKAITYDARWLSKTNWFVAAAIQPTILHFNSREVYCNDLATAWK